MTKNFMLRIRIYITPLNLYTSTGGTPVRTFCTFICITLELYLQQSRTKQSITLKVSGMIIQYISISYFVLTVFIFDRSNVCCELPYFTLCCVQIRKCVHIQVGV